MSAANVNRSTSNEAAIKALRDLAAKWPSTVVSRTEISKFSGGLIAPGTLANLDSAGVGIPGAFRVGPKKAYPVDSAIEWLIGRLEG